MARKIVFPLTVTVEGKVHTFKTHDDLYKFYYSAKINYLTDFSKPFWKEGINLVELVHNPETFTLINNL